VLHLFHPALVHFSVASLVAGGVAESWGLAARREGLARGGGMLVLAGLLSLAPTMFTGYVAANSIDVPAPALDDLGRHELGAWLVAAVFAAALIWKGWLRGQLPDTQRLPYVALLVAGVLLVVWTALAGGEMVFVHGVGVGGL